MPSSKCCREYLKHGEAARTHQRWPWRVCYVNATIIRENGLVHIRADVDRAFRRALLDGVPAPLGDRDGRGLVGAELLPNARRAQKEARRYFGDEADGIFADAARFAGDLHTFLGVRFGLTGLLDWLTATGYGNDYRMIKVFAEWARLSNEVTKKRIIVPRIIRS